MNGGNAWKATKFGYEPVVPYLPLQDVTTGKQA